MPPSTHDPRDIPILTEAIPGGDVAASTAVDAKALQSAILAATLQLADALLYQAAKDIEATLFERVVDRLRAELPELVHRVIREHVPAAASAAGNDADGADHG